MRAGEGLIWFLNWFIEMSFWEIQLTGNCVGGDLQEGGGAWEIRVCY